MMNGWMDGVRRRMINYGVTEDDAKDGDMRRH